MRAGAALLKDGNAEGAIAPLKEAVALQPENIRSLEYLGQALLRSKHHEDAGQVFAGLLALKPAHVEAHHGRGLALHGLKDIPAALAAFRQASWLNPAAWKTWSSIADITPDEAERIHAIGRTADALHTACADPVARPELYLSCAEALIKAKRFEDAIAFIHAHFHRFKDASTAHNKLASAHYHSGAFKEAIHHKQDALAALDPETLPEAPLDNPFVPASAIEVLKAIGDILTDHGVSYFLVAGTLLGFHREGGPLPHDRDVDIGVMRNADGSPDIAAIIRQHPDLLLPHGARPGDRYVGVLHDGVGLDIFLHDDVGDHTLCGFSQHPGDIQWRFSRFGLAEIFHAGRSWFCPDPIERYLEETYGPGWREPDKGFASVISSPALFETDPFARAFYSVARVMNHLKRGDRSKACALIRQSPVPLRASVIQHLGLTSDSARSEPSSDGRKSP